MLNRISPLTLLLLLSAAPAWAQLSDDPSQVPVPPAFFNDPARAVVVEVYFNSATSVSPVGVSVAQTRARSSIANPSQLLVELLNQNGQVISEQFAHYPLWVRDIDDQGQETGTEVPDGPAKFYVPLSETLRSVRITDLQFSQELITIDVSVPVIEYCTRSPPTPICSLFMNGFE